MDLRILPPVDFVIEELFTNMVKYSDRQRRGGALELTKIPGAWK